MHYYYEIYTKHPKTKETGWEIETGWAQVDCVEVGGGCLEIDIAKRKVKDHYPLFDCFITIYQGNMNKNDYITIK